MRIYIPLGGEIYKAIRVPTTCLDAPRFGRLHSKEGFSAVVELRDPRVNFRRKSIPSAERRFNRSTLARVAVHVFAPTPELVGLPNLARM